MNTSTTSLSSAKFLIIGNNKNIIKILIEEGYAKENIMHIDSFHRANRFF